MDLIRIHNRGTELLVLNGNERFEILPGADRIVRFDIAASWFGDPRLRNDTRDQIRSQVYSQVQYMWGWAEGLVREDGQTWEDLCPKVDCFDMDGEPVKFIIHDPDGNEPWTGAAIVDPSTQDSGVLNAQIKQMQDQIAQLTTLLTARADETPTEAPTGEVEPAAIVDMTTLPAAPANETLSDDAPRTTKGRQRANA